MKISKTLSCLCHSFKEKILMEKFHITIEEAVNKLKKEKSNEFTSLMRHGTMSVEYYAPKKTDKQQPHIQDEIYVISSGSGIFFNDGERVKFNTGDVLFVHAGAEHRFENFTDDFATWVIFYGKEGGEKSE
jgi:mannose-6-phosphate isomerase-like protein (cupin superfamily)